MCRNKDKQAIYVSAGNMVNEAFNISINMNMIWCLWWLILMSMYEVTNDSMILWYHDMISYYNMYTRQIIANNNLYSFSCFLRIIEISWWMILNDFVWEYDSEYDMNPWQTR
jgi:hypothetical protein